MDEKETITCAECMFSEERNCELYCYEREHKVLDNETCEEAKAWVSWYYKADGLEQRIQRRGR